MVLTFEVFNILIDFTYCDRFDGTSGMSAATQRIRRPSLGNESINSAWKQKYWSPLPRQRILLTVKRFLSN
jgi:hypothetical protein